MKRSGFGLLRAPLFVVLAACGPATPPPVTTPPTTPPVTTPPLDKVEKLDPVAEAKAFAAHADAELRRVMVAAAVAEWTQETDGTPEHEAAAAKANGEQSVVIAQLMKQARAYEPLFPKLDESTRRQLQVLLYMMPVAATVQPSPDDPKQAEEMAKIAEEMTSRYADGQYCPDPQKKDGCLNLDKLSKTLQTSRDPKVLLDAWKGWHDSVGHEERDLFRKYVPLANAGAKAVGFADDAELWQSGYDMPPDAFSAETDRLWDQVKPLYTQLHCYARRKLNKMYGDKVVPKNGMIPAHLLGNMWAQSWSWLYPEFEPYKGQAKIDVGPTLEKSYDATSMMKMGEAFYTSLGMDPLPATFWQRSMLTRPAGKKVLCHASSWDVHFNDDLRIKMCTEKTQEDLITIHHELGHSYYFAAYYKLPMVFQNGANDGFHEAIGDTVALSMTPGYLHEKGLLDKVEKNDKAELNHLMRVALDKVAFLPFGLLVDRWRWDVFSGKVAPDQYNAHWWELKNRYQGVSEPVKRGPDDFDPGAKFHVASNTPYMRYFLAAVLQFQFHRALCKKAGFEGPLNECSIYNNKEAGAAYQKMLAMGASMPWQDALFELTGQREMDATAMLEYFAPLQRWLENENKGQTCGW